MWFSHFEAPPALSAMANIDSQIRDEGTEEAIDLIDWSRPIRQRTKKVSDDMICIGTGLDSDFSIMRLLNLQVSAHFIKWSGPLLHSRSTKRPVQQVKAISGPNLIRLNGNAAQDALDIDSIYQKSIKLRSARREERPSASFHRLTMLFIIEIGQNGCSLFLPSSIGSKSFEPITQIRAFALSFRTAAISIIFRSFDLQKKSIKMWMSARFCGFGLLRASVLVCVLTETEASLWNIHPIISKG